MATLTASELRMSLSCGRQACACASGPNTHCPGPLHARGDRNPSLTVHDGEGRPVFDCKAGCDGADIIAELQARDLWPRAERTESGPTKIAATYDYRRADGGLAFQVCRLEPKDFRQRRPKPGGGWEWKAGDRSIIYRLPEILAAPDDTIVFVAEGEKDADRLHALGLIATTAAGGAGKWSDANAAWLADRRVVILPDNDAAGEKDAAIKLRSLRAVTQTVALLPLDGLQDKGDVSDWLDGDGTDDRLVELAESALAQVPESDVKPVPPPSLALFPTDVLSPSMRGLVKAASAAMLVPPEFVAVPLLVLAGAVIGNAWEIELKGGWKEGPNLYAAVVGDPGAKKTPSLRLAMRAIHEIQQRLSADYRARKSAYDEEKTLWDRTPKKERGPQPQAPTYPHVWTADATTEALAGMLSGSKGLALIRDELVGWVKSMDAYRSGGKGADRQNYLSMWSRSPIKIDRKGNPEPIIVSRPCLSVFGGIQPDVLPDLVGQAERDDGFVDRLLFSYPDLGRDRWSSAGVDESVTSAVEGLFSRLYDLVGAEMPSGDIVPRVARFDGDAARLWGQWYNANDDELRDDGLPASLKGTWAKLPSQLARLTLILHVTRCMDAGLPVSATIDLKTLEDGCDLLDYFREHARAALAELRTPRVTMEDRILQGLRDKGPSTTRTLHRDVFHEKVKLDRLKATMEHLLEDGRVRIVDAPTTAKGGRPTKIWEAIEQERPRRRSPSTFTQRGAS